MSERAYRVIRTRVSTHHTIVTAKSPQEAVKMEMATQGKLWTNQKDSYDVYKHPYEDTEMLYSTKGDKQ